MRIDISSGDYPLLHLYMYTIIYMIHLYLAKNQMNLYTIVINFCLANITIHLYIHPIFVYFRI